MTDFAQAAWDSVKTAASTTVAPVTQTVAAATQPVSGTVNVANLPATQPVSAATLPLPAGAATDGTDASGVTPPSGGSSLRGWLSGIYSRLGGTLSTARTWVLSSTTDSVNVGNFPSTQTVSGSVSVSNLPATQAVSLATAPTTPVTGTFWPATQPVSGSVTVSNFPATQPVSGSVAVSNLPATQAVSGSVSVGNFPATQPVSLASNTPDVTDRAARLLGHVTVDNAALTVTQAALTKGTQGTNGVTTQDLKDAGRTYVTLTATGVVSVITTAALMTLTINSGGTPSSATSYTVPTGKTFRIQAIQFGARFTTPSTTVTFASTTFVVRQGIGTVTVTSNVLHQDSKLAASNAPVPNSDLPLPEGLELPAGTTIGVTHLASAATLSEDVAIIGYLY